jgi:hypothetical protein
MRLSDAKIAIKHRKTAVLRMIFSPVLISFFRGKNAILVKKLNVA